MANPEIYSSNNRSVVLRITNDRSFEEQAFFETYINTDKDFNTYSRGTTDEMHEKQPLLWSEILRHYKNSKGVFKQSMGLAICRSFNLLSREDRNVLLGPFDIERFEKKVFEDPFITAENILGMYANSLQSEERPFSNWISECSNNPEIVASPDAFKFGALLTTYPFYLRRLEQQRHSH